MFKDIGQTTRFLGILLLWWGCISGQIHLDDPYVLTALVALTSTQTSPLS